MVTFKQKIQRSDRRGFDRELYDGYRTVKKNGFVKIDNKFYSVSNKTLIGEKVYLMRNPHTHTKYHYDLYLGDEYIETLTEYKTLDKP